MWMRLAMLAAVAVALVATSAAGTDNGVRYYLSLGDSLAAGTNATEVGVGFSSLGYADQLHAALATDDPKLELVKLGCPGESSVSMRFGSQLPSVVGSCGPPRFYKSVLYPKGTQLTEAVSFLEAHKGKVTLVTINIGAGDLNRSDAQGNLVVCLLEQPAGCEAQGASLRRNLAAILSDLRAAAGPDVQIVGMTYYDVFAPLCVSQPALLFVCSRVDALNALIADTYAGAGVPVADVAGAFENDALPNAAANVCAWTWFCSVQDSHPNAIGYGVIAQAFLDVLQP